MQPAAGMVVGSGHEAAGVRCGAANRAATPLTSTRLSDGWQPLPAAMAPTLKEDGHEQGPAGTLGTERGAALPGRNRVRLDSRQGDVVSVAGSRAGGRARLHRHGRDVFRVGARAPL